MILNYEFNIIKRNKILYLFCKLIFNFLIIIFIKKKLDKLAIHLLINKMINIKRKPLNSFSDLITSQKSYDLTKTCVSTNNNIT